MSLGANPGMGYSEYVAKIYETQEELGRRHRREDAHLEEGETRPVCKIRSADDLTKDEVEAIKRCIAAVSSY
jgi:hypothetical protein